MRASMLEDHLNQVVGPRVPGLAVLIVGAEGVRAHAAAGVADLSSGAPMTTHVAVPWFSMTKLVTATVAVKLASRGILPLDSPLLPLLPVMSCLRPAAWAAQITARHLLQHSAGLANPIPLAWIHPAAQPGPDPQEFLFTRLTKNPRLRSQPGVRARYSNLGPLLLAAAVAQATGIRFEDVVHREVLQPTGMTGTDFGYPPDSPAATGNHPRTSPMRLLLPRWVRGDRHGSWLSLRPFLVDGAAYGGLVGSAEDAALFLRMHLADGRLDGRQVLAADDATEMRQISVHGRRYDHGLGWFTPSADPNHNPPFVEHLGGGAGFYNVMRLYPTLGVGAVVMGNATHYDIDTIARLALTTTT